ncbi:MAG: SDR family NAD(P)-dependent oxidoreductase [Propionibacteriaceae bacterium]
MATALVTGATSGIGSTFTTHLAARGDDLVLVARSVERLEERATELGRAYGVKVEVLAADLSDRDQVLRVADRIAGRARAGDQAGQAVDLVVNNAGFGVHTRLLDEDAMSHIDPALEVMVRSVIMLSGAAGRAMSARGSGAIVNVSSTAGFMSMGVYSAIKDCVTVYTEALSNELRGSGVTATALCPGYVHTEFHQRAGIRTGTLPGPAWVDPDQLVRECLADVAKGKVISIPSARYAVAIALARRVPRALIRSLSARLTSTR